MHLDSKQTNMKRTIENPHSIKNVSYEIYLLLLFLFLRFLNNIISSLKF